MEERRARAEVGGGKVAHIQAADAGAPPRFDTLRSMVAFILFAAIVAPSIVSTLNACLFVLTEWDADFWRAWQLRFLALVFPTLMITPLIVLTVGYWFFQRRSGQFGEEI